jgi:hypothetical protein
MTISIATPRDRRFLVAAFALVPLALALGACSGKDSGNRTTSDAAGSPTIISTSVTSSTDGSSAPFGGPVVPATYTDAETAYQAGNYVGARRMFESYIITRPENPWGHYMLGLSAWKSGDLNSAEEAFAHAIALDSTHLKSYVNSARVLLDLGRNHEALERGQRAIVTWSVAKTIVGMMVPLKLRSKTLSNPSVLRPKNVSSGFSVSLPSILSSTVVAAGELPPAPLISISMEPNFA